MSKQGEHQNTIGKASFTDALLQDAKGRAGSRAEEKVHPTDVSAAIETSGCNHSLKLSIHFYIQVLPLSLTMLQNITMIFCVSICIINKKLFRF